MRAGQVDSRRTPAKSAPVSRVYNDAPSRQTPGALGTPGAGNGLVPSPGGGGGGNGAAAGGVGPSKKDSTLAEIQRLEKKREERRKYIANARIERAKEEKRNIANGNPGDVDFQRMIRRFRAEREGTCQPHVPAGDLKICIAIRKRPISEKEVKRKDHDSVTVLNPKTVVHDCKLRVDGISKFLDNSEFQFDHTFDEVDDTDLIYDYTTEPLVPFVLNKGRATVFAYGQTGSGKTYTMVGIQRRASADLFRLLESNPAHNNALAIHVSFFEIYGGRCQDLLNERHRLIVREDGQGEVHIAGLNELAAGSEQELEALIDKGNSNRTTHATESNDTSSRSHAICQIALRQKSNGKLHGKLSLIDLAGSERGADTKSHNRQRRMEGAEINKSLLALKECIRALDSESVHVPYRASKLTLVLKDSFTRKSSRTVMIATVSPSASSADHTLNTLRYAYRVKEKKVSNFAPVMAAPGEEEERLVEDVEDDVEDDDAFGAGNGPPNGGGGGGVRRGYSPPDDPPVPPQTQQQHAVQQRKTSARAVAGVSSSNSSSVTTAAAATAAGTTPEKKDSSRPTKAAAGAPVSSGRERAKWGAARGGGGGGGDAAQQRVGLLRENNSSNAPNGKVGGDRRIGGGGGGVTANGSSNRRERRRSDDGGAGGRDRGRRAPSGDHAEYRDDGDDDDDDSGGDVVAADVVGDGDDGADVDVELIAPGKENARRGQGGRRARQNGWDRGGGGGGGVGLGQGGAARRFSDRDGGDGDDGDGDDGYPYGHEKEDEKRQHAGDDDIEFLHKSIRGYGHDDTTGSEEVEELHRAVQSLFEEEEALLNLHMNVIQENAELLTEEGRLLQQIQGDNVVDYDIDAYASRLSEILDRKMRLMGMLQSRLAKFRRHLEEEENVSKRVQRMPQY